MVLTHGSLDIHVCMYALTLTWSYASVRKLNYLLGWMQTVPTFSLTLCLFFISPTHLFSWSLCMCDAERRYPLSYMMQWPREKHLSLLKLHCYNGKNGWMLYEGFCCGCCFFVFFFVGQVNTVHTSREKKSKRSTLKGKSTIKSNLHILNFIILLIFSFGFNTFLICPEQNTELYNHWNG